MSVLHILPTFGTGGLGACCLNMIAGWPTSTTHQVLSPMFPGATAEMLPAFIDRIGRENVAQIPRGSESPPVWAEVVARRLEVWWRTTRPTHVIQYNVLDLIYSLYAVRRSGWHGRVVTHIGTTLDVNRLTRGIFTSPLLMDTRLIPIHQAIAARTLELGTDPAKVSPVIWNGTDLARFTGPQRTRALTFGFVGRMCHPEQKNWSLLFDGFRKAAPSIPGATLRIAGHGPDQPRLEALAAGLPVEFVGNKTPDEMPDFYRSLDVFVMASHQYEGFSCALMEAVGSRCLMLGTDVPGVREPFEYGNGGRFCAKTSDDLAALMRELQTPENLNRNRDMVEMLRPKLAAENMARAYYEAGL